MPNDAPDIARATLPLPEGIAALEIPRPISKQSVASVRAWVDVVIALAENQAIDSPSYSPIPEQPKAPNVA